MEPQIASAHAMPVLDEATFQQILAAAYVIQQQNELQGTRRKLDPATTLAEIAETQELLRSKIYDLAAAANLIQERLKRITSANGIAVALIHGNELEYRAATGTFSQLAGAMVPVDSTLSDLLREEEKRHGKAEESQTGFVLNQDSASPFFFPVFHDGKVAALIELTFPDTELIQEHEIRCCQLMAGLLGEAIARAAEMEWKRALAAERATMLEALEKLKPQLERLTSEAPKSVVPTAPSQSPEKPKPAPASEPLPELPAELIAAITAPPKSEIELPQQPLRIQEVTEAHEDLAPPATAALAGEADAAANDIRPSSSCEECGHPFREGEMFCGRCGTPRTMELLLPNEPSTQSLTEGTAQAEVSDEAADETLLELPQLEPPQREIEFHPSGPSNALPAVIAETSIDRPAEHVTAVEGSSALAVDHLADTLETSEDTDQKGKLEVVRESVGPKPSPWASAARTRKWLESLQRANSPARIWMTQHGGDLSIVVAVLVLVFVLSGLGTHPTRTAAHAKTPPQPSLTFFERMLVDLGIAEPPPAPVNRGNPNVQVWVDLHTALYYCPGTDLYGKTPDGKFTTQRDAQLDQFEPAARKNCE